MLGRPLPRGGKTNSGFVYYTYCYGCTLTGIVIGATVRFVSSLEVFDSSFEDSSDLDKSSREDEVYLDLVGFLIKGFTLSVL